MKIRLTLFLVMVAAVWCISDVTLATQTIAYYEFEGPVTTIVADSNGRAGPLNLVRTPAIDSSGNGNTAYAWTGGGWGQYLFDARVPAATVPQTGAPDTTSVHANYDGSGAWWPVITTVSWLTSPSGIDAETWYPKQWTLEASFNITRSLGAWGDFIGRAGETIKDQYNGWLAPVYFQKTDTDQVRIQYVDNALNNWNAVDPNKITVTNTWFQAIATCDGLTLRLYDNVAADGTQAAALALVASTDVSTSVDSGMIDAAKMQSGGAKPYWMFGAGQWNGGDTDRLFGNMDNIRMTDGVLDSSKWLCIPEPATYAMLIMGGLCLLLYRRTRKK